MSRVVALIAVIPAAATLYFAVLWSRFAWWRRHPVLAYTMMLATLGGAAVGVFVCRDAVLAYGFDPPTVVSVVGWALVMFALVFGTVADRQLGFYVRSFAPFFERRGRIELKTSGAYAIVRHPIYASGIWFQLGVFAATGYIAVAIATVVFATGALWFTRKEEQQLIALLDDPSAYERYRARVPALFPWVSGARRART